VTVRWWGSGEIPSNEPRYVRIAACALCVEDGRLLLARVSTGYAEAGAWTLPGGGLEFGERPETGVLRELEEECGLRGETAALLAIDSQVYGPRAGRDGHLLALRIIYRVRVTGGELRNERDGSTDECSWVALVDVPALPLVPLAEVGLRLARAELKAV
jgi:ADP-ribose pyrophosphatase YjhB (NUDIX family)